MVLPDRLRPPRHLLVIFVAATVLLALALGWLAWIRLAELDRQQAQSALDAATVRVVSEIRQRLDDLSRNLPTLARATDVVLPDDSVLLVVTADGVEARPAGRLLYHPHAPGGSLARTAALDAAAALEGRRDFRAAAAYRRAATSTEPSTRAAALIGEARVLRRDGQPRDALAVYHQRLAGLRRTPREGTSLTYSPKDSEAVQTGARRGCALSDADSPPPA